MTIWQLVVGVVVGGFLLLLVAAILFSPLGQANEGTNRTVCRSNLSYIHKAIALYCAANDSAWPWIGSVTSDWSAAPVGTNRNRSPMKDSNSPGDRSITSLMFLLVRMNQSPGMFRCPSDKNSEVDREVKADANDGDVLKGEYYWDFAKPENVSFSLQAPIWRPDPFAQGLTGAIGANANESEMAICADMTPRYGGYGDEKWIPISIDDRTPRTEIEKQLSNNHNGKQVNVLTLAGDARAHERPDVGVGKDNIYTASGKPNAGSRSATSLDIRQHLSPRDTFLIGPVGRAEE